MAVESALAAERGSAFTSMAVESAKAAGRERESASTSTAGEGELAAEREGERGLAFTSMAVEGELAASVMESEGRLSLPGCWRASWLQRVRHLLHLYSQGSARSTPAGRGA
jgi:hypothetical protein